MLWFKAWLETRTRFLIALLGITALCCLVVYHGDKQGLPETGPQYYYVVLAAAGSLLCLLWLVAVTLLMMGGLLREKAVGAAPFTLALPISRARLMGVRIGMGLVQAMALAVVPWTAIFLTALATGKANSLYQVFFHLVLLISGGLVFFGVALLSSSLVQGEYTAPMLSLGIVLGAQAILSNGSRHTYTPLGFATGAEYYPLHAMLLQGPIPWPAAAINVLCAALLIAISVKVVQRHEF
jgi:ABC-2 type transport system permease protein